MTNERAPRTAEGIALALMAAYVRYSHLSYEDPTEGDLKEATLVLRWLAAERVHTLRDVTEEEIGKVLAPYWDVTHVLFENFRKAVNALLASRHN